MAKRDDVEAYDKDRSRLRSNLLEKLAHESDSLRRRAMRGEEHLGFFSLHWGQWHRQSSPGRKASP